MTGREWFRPGRDSDDVERETTYTGERLRQLRTDSDLTLAVLAENVGLSKGYLSQIESGKKVPHWSTLMRILHRLDATLCGFLADGGDQERRLVQGVAPGGDPILLSGHLPDEWGVVPEADTEGYTWILTPDPTGTLRCEVLRFRIPPHSAWTPEMIRFSGWGQIYVLEGRILLEVGRSERDEFTLDRGETLGYDGRLPHRFRNYTDSPTEVLLTVTPPAV